MIPNVLFFSTEKRHSNVYNSKCWKGARCFDRNCIICNQFSAKIDQAFHKTTLTLTQKPNLIKKNKKKTTLNQDYILLPKFSKHSVFLVFISEVFDWEESGVLLISTWELNLSSLNILSCPQFPFLSHNLVVKKIWKCRKSSREYKIICAGKT